jgi:hypothetical protein
MPERVLSETEFNAIGQKLLQQAPAGLSEPDFHRWIGSRFAAAIGEAENLPPTPEGSALGRFVSNAGEMLNPVAAVKGVANAVQHPIETLTNIGRASLDQGQKALDNAKSGRVSEALGHAAAMFPVVGPAAAAAGEQIAAGDVAGGLGKGAGMLIPTAIPSAVRAAKAVAPVRAAAALEKGAAARVTETIAPKVGANKTRFGNMAEAVAPEIAAKPELSAWSREGLHAKVKQGLVAAEQGLDEAADARLSARTFPTKPLIEGLLEKRRQLTAEAVEGSSVPRTAVERTSSVLDEQGKPVTVTDLKQKPIGKDVVPGPNAGRVAEIDRAISELKQLGPVTRYEPIRLIRQAYDGPAKTVYNPSLTADFLKAQGSKLGAADVTSVFRDQLAKWDPQTAAANSDYSLFRKMDDVLEATREVERVRPKVGRQIMARLTGVMFGSEAAGVKGAVAGYLGGPIVDSLLSSAPTTKIKTAQIMAQMAKAIRTGNTGQVESLTASLRRLGATAATVVGNATSPSGFQTQTTAQAR